MVTLFAMGGATTLIGLLPTYDTWGIWAPILLITLRIIQGISAGGEWGSAVLLAVEHAQTTNVAYTALARRSVCLWVYSCPLVFCRS